TSPIIYFTAPLSTDNYTLSLHDALPISIVFNLWHTFSNFLNRIKISYKNKHEKKAEQMQFCFLFQMRTGFTELSFNCTGKSGFVYNQRISLLYASLNCCKSSSSFWR